MSKYIDADALIKYLDELRRDATEPHLTPQAAVARHWNDSMLMMIVSGSWSGCPPQMWSR